MKIAVTTPSGHVGSAVVDYLLDYGGHIHVKLLARRSRGLDGFINRGAEIAIGAQDDSVYLTWATQDVDALFWVTPPGYGSDNVRAFQNRMGAAASFAIRANKIPQVVNLSSIGAYLDSGAGPISGLHDVELLLSEASDNIMHLRPGFFFENLLMQFDAIHKWKRISLPLSGERRYPMIATRDIGRVAAERLVDPFWSGHNVRELHGPADLCFDEVADILSKVLGFNVIFVQCDWRQFRQSLLDAGMSENLADLMLEMYEAVDTGRIRSREPRSPQTTTPTTLAEFAREVMLPMLAQPIIH
jgi:uncharacterized protein YbjT (DUF2867 family)